MLERQRATLDADVPVLAPVLAPAVAHDPVQALDAVSSPSDDLKKMNGRVTNGNMHGRVAAQSHESGVQQMGGNWAVRERFFLAVRDSQRQRDPS